jgi:hypothetical protein
MTRNMFNLFGEGLNKGWRYGWWDMIKLIEIQVTEYVFYLVSQKTAISVLDSCLSFEYSLCKYIKVIVQVNYVIAQCVLHKVNFFVENKLK